MAQNIRSLSLLRNGKVYLSKENARIALERLITNDGVANLARYLDEQQRIRTLIGFYANADEMEEAGGGSSYNTIVDIDGTAGDVEQIKRDIAEINEKIGEGIDGTTLTDAINDINDRLGSGFTEDHTVADALEELADELTELLEISLEVAGEPTSGYLKTYILSQGNAEIGRIDIPKDLVVTSGSLVHGTWSGDTFTEDPEGTDTAIKLVIANQEEPVYINTKDLVDYYNAGDGINIDNNSNVISIKIDESGEPFLTVGEDGLKLDGVRVAIDEAIELAKLHGSDGISIAANEVKAVAAKYSSEGVKNAIMVDSDGIKMDDELDCGYFDSSAVIAESAADIAAITDKPNTSLFVGSSDALNSMTNRADTYKSIDVSNVSADNQIYLTASESISVDNVEITGTKGSTNGYILYSSPKIDVSNLSIANGSTAYNVFEGDQTNQNLEELNASYVTVDNPSLAHNVFNVYKPKDDAVINIKDSVFNLTVDNSNALRLANYGNATGVTVNFENIDWTYENSLSANDWRWAGLIIYQPATTDAGLSGDLSFMETWKFNFKNCKYNGVKVTENNFGQHNQVFYTYNVGGSGAIRDASLTFDVTFE